MKPRKLASPPKMGHQMLPRAPAVGENVNEGAADAKQGIIGSVFLSLFPTKPSIGVRGFRRCYQRSQYLMKDRRVGSGKGN